MILRFRSERRWLGNCQSLWYAFGFAEELRPIYARFGHALPDKEGDDRRWIYRNRLEPAEIVADLTTLVKVSNH